MADVSKKMMACLPAINAREVGWPGILLTTIFGVNYESGNLIDFRGARAEGYSAELQLLTPVTKVEYLMSPVSLILT